MNLKLIIQISIICLFFAQCKEVKTETNIEEVHTKPKKNRMIPNSNIDIFPITHATLVLRWNGKTIYIDPTGGDKAFKTHELPDLILITDIHEDHMDIETLNSLELSSTTLITPATVAEKLPASYTDNLAILHNGETITRKEITIEAIPKKSPFHEKGDGNGYIITLGKERVYISGDTEAILEHKVLIHIDIAFVGINTVEQAAEAVLSFQPKYVYPYHYKGKEGCSDVTIFENLVTRKNQNIKVIRWNEYPEPE